MADHSARDDRMMMRLVGQGMIRLTAACHHDHHARCEDLRCECRCHMSRDRGRHHERLHGSQRIVDLAPTSTPGRLRGLVVNVRSGYAWIKAGAVEYFGGDENLSLVPQPDGSQRIPPPLRVGMAVEFTPAADPRGKQPLARLIVIIETR